MDIGTLHIYNQTHHTQHIYYHIWAIAECGIDASSMCTYLVYYTMSQICISIDYLIIIQAYLRCFGILLGLRFCGTWHYFSKLAMLCSFYNINFIIFELE